MVAAKAYCESSYMSSSLVGVAAPRHLSEGELHVCSHAVELVRQRDTPARSHAQAPVRRAVRARSAERPEPAVREVEEHDQAEHHEPAGGPDEVDAGVLRDDEPGEPLLTLEGEAEACQLLGRPLGQVVDGGGAAGVALVDLDAHLPGRNQRSALTG